MVRLVDLFGVSLQSKGEENGTFPFFNSVRMPLKSFLLILQLGVSVKCEICKAANRSAYHKFSSPLLNQILWQETFWNAASIYFKPI